MLSVASITVIIGLYLPFSVVGSNAPYVPQTKTTTPVALTVANFDAALSDPSNPFWFLKFFAPWCGHCKRLAPVLDAVAPKVAGKMSIGTIDCTVEKSLCDKYKVRGYPTLKFAVEGDVLDYPGGRSEEELIDFASKMSAPPVTLVKSVTEAKAFKGTEGVSFVGYHPAVVTAEGDLDTKLASSNIAKVYGQVARKMQAVGSFLLIDTSTTNDDEAAASAVSEISEGPFICRLESGVEPRCYFRISDSMDEGLLLQWVKKENLPTVSMLGANNFHNLGRMGRPLCIAVYSDPESIPEAKKKLTDFALKGPEAIRNKYYYAYMDGARWGSFLSQFEVRKSEMPLVFILDVPRKDYWTNATYGLDVAKFMAAVEDGTVGKKKSGPGGAKGALENFLRIIVDYMPWSLGVVIILILACVVGTVRCCISSAKGLRPPYPRTDETAETEEEKEEEPETKKDK